LGPITLFDKSFLQALSTDESVWFDNFFYPVICPIFFVETMADLWKTPRAGKTAEEEVGIIAAKCPEMSGTPCYFHEELCLGSLAGNDVPMDGRIPRAGIRQVVREGKVAGVAEVSDEADAFQRWQRGRFYEVERNHASEWRRRIESTDLGIIEARMKQLGVSAKTCKSLTEAVRYADQGVVGLSKTPERFSSALELLGIRDEARPFIKSRWRKCQRPPLTVFAPYAAHVLRVELFFHIAIGANLIASTRPSHRVDVAYLFYLPFCQVFTSADKLHRQCAPLFMRPNQEFVWGLDLKADLQKLNEHYQSLPHEVRSQGLYKFANTIPDQSQGVIRELIRRHTPNMLTRSTALDGEKLNQPTGKKLFEEMKKWESAPEAMGTPPDANEWESLIIKRSVRRQRGSWQQIGPEVGDSD
jgi:hypothetical protein